MANVRDSDTSLWLHNKLGTSNDSWTGGSICSQLNAEVLRNIKDCFPDLQTQVKLKLLLSFFHIPRRNVEEWRNELEEILEVACLDSELWVSMLAETMKTYPGTGSLNTEISDFDETRPIFADLVNEIKKLVNRQCDNLNMLPLECHYLNKSALVSVVGQLPSPVRHFTLKRKPKSAALRAELLQKSADAASSVKKVSAPTVPVRSRGMPRKMTDTTPLKGIPSRVPMSGFRSPPSISPSAPGRPALIRNPAGRKDGGIKLLDITEQPLGFAAAKKKKRMQELEEQKKASEAAAAAHTPPVSSNTPDYAAGLTSTVVFSQPQTPSPASTVISKELPTTPLSSSSITTSSTGTGTGTSSSTSSDISTPSSYTPGTPIPRAPTYIPPPTTNPVPTQTIILTPNSIRPPNLSESSNSPSTPVTKVNKVIVTTSPLQKGKPQTVILANAGVLQKNIILGMQKGTLVSGNTVLQLPLKHNQVITPVQGISAIQSLNQNSNLTPPSVVPNSTVTNVRIQPPPAQPPQRKGLSLTREQMLEAQDMFSKANKVTRPEKALILGFMAGSRDNPCPDLGNTVTIKLSENQENVLQEDDTYRTMWVETHFQMNYDNGEWERIKKYRRLEPIEPHLQNESVAHAV